MTARRSFALMATLLGVVPAGCGGVDADLRALAEERRPLVARLSIARRRASCVTPGDQAPPGGARCRHAPLGPRDAARVARLTEAFRTTDLKSPRALHQKALWHLLWPDVPGSVDSAIAAFTLALELDSTNAAGWSDLAAAWLAKAEKEGGFAAAIDALDAAERARALDEGLPVARFNRALALGRVHLDSAVQAEWRAYRNLDHRSAWAREIERRLAAATGPARSDRRPQEMRDALESDVLAAWAAAARRGDGTGATRALSRAESLARAIERAGDGLYREAVDSIQASAGGGARARSLAEGHDAFASGLELFRARAVDSAAKVLAVSQRLLAASGSPMSGRAALYLAWCRFQHARYDETLSLLGAVVRSRPAQRHHVLRAHALRAQGLIHGIETRHAHALAALSHARLALGSADDPPLRSRIEGDAATVLLDVGMEDAAWPHWDRGLLAAARSGPYDRLAVYGPMAKLGLQRGRPWAALRFQSEVLFAAQAARDHAATAGGLRERAEMLSGLGHRDSALTTLAAAARAADGIPDSITRRIVRADVMLVAGETRAASAPDQAMSLLDSALTVFDETRYHLKRVRVYLARATAHLARARPDQAEQEFAAALRKIDEEHGALLSPVQRTALLDRARPILERLVLVRLDRGDTLGAWQAFESFRTRGRLGSEVIALGTRLPSHVTLAVFALLENELVTWGFRAGRTLLVRQAVQRGIVERVAGELRAALMADRGEASQAIGAQLYGWLLAPLHALAGADTALVVVPDGALHRIPFAATWDATGERFTVERWEITIAASVADYLEAQHRARAPRAAPHRVLAVGAPAFDRSLYPLDPLAGAAREARAVAVGYANRTVLTGRDATVDAFLTAAREAGVVHFAGHAVIRNDAPAGSFLLFAGRNPVLSVEAVAAARLEGPRVVVLSACHTARGSVSWSEGPANLAGAFLDAGVPAVIASLWVLDDARTVPLVERLHDGLRRGIAPSAALRRAQLESLRSRAHEPTRLWAGLQAYGV